MAQRHSWRVGSLCQVRIHQNQRQESSEMMVESETERKSLSKAGAPGTLRPLAGLDGCRGPFTERAEQGGGAAAGGRDILVGGARGPSRWRRHSRRQIQVVVLQQCLTISGSLKSQTSPRSPLLPTAGSPSRALPLRRPALRLEHLALGASAPASPAAMGCAVPGQTTSSHPHPASTEAYRKPSWLHRDHILQ